MRASLTLMAVFLLFRPELFSQTIHPRFFMTGDYSIEQLATSVSPNPLNIYPAFSKRADWEALDEEIKTLLIENGEAALKKEWPILTSSQYMMFTAIGDRVGYEGLYFERRNILQDLVFAELVEGKGKYLSKIIDGIWLICEESTWSIPAHLYLQSGGSTPLPVPEEHVVDLFAAETGATLSWIYYLLKAPLDEITPLVRERMKVEIDKRILTPNITRDDFWWMSFKDPKRVNNWNPWVNSNWINCIALIEDDPQRKVESIYKTMKSMDHFINIYPEDGGCDEGPSYWGRAGGSMFDYLEILYHLTDGNIDIFKQQVIKNMAAYIYKVNINDDYYVNFADAAAKNSPPLELIYSWGGLGNDKTLTDFAVSKVTNFKSFYPNQSMNRRLRSIFTFDQIKELNAKLPIIQDVWLAESEVYVSRDYKNSVNGFYLAGKGGHNAESHNHNDVGNYMIFFNGKPIIIDVGVEQYTAKTFSPQRYEIWTMQSQYHTLPVVNGVDQKNGREYAASNFNYTKKGPLVTIGINLEDAYPDEAFLDQWKRTITHRKGKFISVEETFNLSEIKGKTILNFMTPCETEVNEGKIIFRQKMDDISFEVSLVFDAAQLNPVVQPISINDKKLQNSWGNQLYRVQLELVSPQQQNQVTYTFAQH